MPSILITGSNRGLGLEWARQHARDGWRVYATCRAPEAADQLVRLAADHPNLSLHRLDVTVPDQVAALADELADAALDHLINNAGVYFERWGRDKLGHIDYGAWADTLAVNLLGAVRVTEALAPQVGRSERRLVLAITSHMGSITDITSPNDYAYRSSKAAMSAAFRGLAAELRPRGIGVLLLHPGWVRTRMGGEQAPVGVEDSVRGMRHLADTFTAERSGLFFRYDGVPMPW